MKTMKNLKNMTLEVSLKPFKDISAEGMEQVAREIFNQWSALIRHADSVSVMLWTSDGSEILDYRGDLDDTFDWTRYIGCCNQRNGPLRKMTPDAPSSLNNGYFLYRENPPVYTYRILLDLVGILRSVGKEVTGKPVRVGDTFDPGPEFSDSSFKYERHPEINVSLPLHGKNWFMCSYSRLHADNRRYAGYPDGIPEGTSIGEFLGRQSQHFLTDLGFDFLWLSNGFGFGRDPWQCTGELFDGKAFYPQKAEKARKYITDFWAQFRKECPDIRLEVRGTNMGVGSDIASDGISFRDLYDGGLNFKPPPNSPWAALNSDFGLELTGYMSRISELPPEEGYPFRFYTHDPWWMNSPWIDRYERQPHDIYMPLALSRIDKDGKACYSDSINFTSIDNSLGGMPDCVPNEIIPHVIRAYANAPDAPPPLLWVYPFDEYDKLGKEGKHLQKMYFEDWYVRSAINYGLPLTGVVSTGNFVKSIKQNPALYDGVILVTTLPEKGSLYEETLCEHIENGGWAMFYGALSNAGDRLLSLLGLSCKEQLSGECILCVDSLLLDSVGTSCAQTFFHDPLLSDGGLRACPGDGSVGVLARAVKDGKERVVAVSRELPAWRGGKAVWLRGTSSNTVSIDQMLPVPHDVRQYFPMESLAKAALQEFGYRILFTKSFPEQKGPAFMVHRCENAFFFSGCSPDSTVEISLRFPLGAPLLLGCDTFLKDGGAVYRMPRAWYHECRIFVTQQDSAETLKCVEDTCRDGRYHRHLRIRGLNNATVYIFPYPDYREKVKIMCGVERYDANNTGVPFEKELVQTSFGPAWRCTDVSGTLSFLTELDDDVLW